MAVEYLLNPDPMISQPVDSEGNPVAEAGVSMEEGLAIEPQVRRDVPAIGRIEEQGLEWADRRRRRIFEGQDTRPVRVMRKRNQDILDYPNLVENDERIKVSPRGEVYVIRWDEPKEIVEGGVRMLKDPDDYDQILRQREHTIDLSGPLPPRKVKEKVPMRNKTIEGAIRQAKLITGERAEEEFAQIAKAMGSVDSIVEQTLSQGLNRKSIADLAERTAAVLEESGLSRARSSTKKAIDRALTRAAELYGSKIPRPNPLITRTLARSAALNAAKREAEAVLTSGKFSSVRGLLLMAREYNRAIAGGAMKDLDTFAGITKRGPAVFQTEHPKVYRGEIGGMQEVLWATARSLTDANVGPYKLEATKAAINLVGCPEEDRDLCREIIGEGADDLFALPSVTALIEQKDFQGAKRRIIESSYSPLEKVLADNQNIGQDQDVGPEEIF